MIAPKRKLFNPILIGTIMKKEYISEVAWSKIFTFLKSCKGIYIGSEAHSKKNIWSNFLEFCIEDPDLEYIMIDTTIVRAHACAAGYGKQEEEGLGRSRGGFTSKIHAKVDALGNPLQFILTPGQAGDITQAQFLLKTGFDSLVLADRAYGSNEVRTQIRNQNCIDVTPSKVNSLEPVKYDKHAYKERYAIECFFGKIKYFRRMFSRFDKSARNFISFLSFVGACIWLR